MIGWRRQRRPPGRDVSPAIPVPTGRVDPPTASASGGTGGDLTRGAGFVLPRAVRDAGARAVLVTRVGCHLCEQARIVLDEYLPEDQLAVLDVDGDPELRSRFTDHVPVVVLDGRLLAYWLLPAERLVHALENPDWASPPPV